MLGSGPLGELSTSAGSGAVGSRPRGTGAATGAGAGVGAAAGAGSACGAAATGAAGAPSPLVHCDGTSVGSGTTALGCDIDQRARVSSALANSQATTAAASAPSTTQAATKPLARSERRPRRGSSDAARFERATIRPPSAGTRSVDRALLAEQCDPAEEIDGPGELVVGSGWRRAVGGPRGPLVRVLRRRLRGWGAPGSRPRGRRGGYNRGAGSA